MTQPIGEHLRSWRQRRRLSQLELALDAEISQRHLSFVESGRAAPSREMVLHLSDRLDVPLRERNLMLLAAGFAPVFSEQKLDAPSMASMRAAVDRVLAAHEPFPALAIDRHWNLIAANRMIAPLLAGIGERLLAPPINVLTLSLDPDGLAPRIVNLAEWRAHLLARLRRQADEAKDPELHALYERLTALPIEEGGQFVSDGLIAVPLRLNTPYGVLSLISTTMVFGAPLDVTLSELAIETFLPADETTAQMLDAIRRDQLKSSA